VLEVVFLGTAGGMPAVDRGLPALLVVHGRRRVLVDCGEGTQRQLLESGLGLRRLDTVLLTHGDLDHVLGIGGLIGTAALLRTTDRMTVHGGASTLRVVRTLLDEVVWPGRAPWLEVRAETLLPGVRIEDGRLRVRAFPVRHRGTDSFGFVFEEKPHRRMRPERLAALGVPPGPERRRLLAGETVTLAGGRLVAPDEVLTPSRAGARLAVVGDAASTDGLADEVRGVEALIIEATFLERDADKARARHHITAAEAARLAAEADVGALYLTHLSGRYRDEEVLAEARAIFPPAVVARDFDRITVRATARD
jgi:ribonuclease Z